MMNNEVVQNLIYKAIEIANSMTEINISYVVPFRRGPDGEGPLVAIYSENDFKRDCFRISQIISPVPDEHLSPLLMMVKQNEYNQTVELLKNDLMNRLESLGFPGYIKNIDLIFNLFPKNFKVILWPNGEAKMPRSIPPCTEFIPGWRYFLELSTEANLFYELKVSAKWEFELKTIVFNWNLSVVDQSEIGKISSKEIFKIEKMSFDKLNEISQLRFNLDHKLEQKFIQFTYIYFFSLVILNQFDNAEFSDNYKNVLTKLINSQHLNVSDRKLLFDGRAKTKILIKIICEHLESEGQFPPKIDLKNDFIGCSIQMENKNRFHVVKKEVIGQNQFKIVYEDYFDTGELAARTFLNKSFQDNIEGVILDWS